MYAAPEPMHNSSCVSQSDVTTSGDTRGQPSLHPPTLDSQQHSSHSHTHHEQHQQQPSSHHHLASTSIPSPSSATSPFYLGTTTSSSYRPHNYQDTFTDAQMADFIADVAEAPAAVSCNGSFLNDGSGGSSSMPFDPASIPSTHAVGYNSSISIGASSSRLSPAAVPPIHLTSDSHHHLQATPTRHSPYVGGSAALYGSPLSSSPTPLHSSGSPRNQSQTVHGGSQPSAMAERSSNLAPKRSDSGASIGGTPARSGHPSTLAKLEAGSSDRGTPSPQEVNKDAEATAEKRQSNRFVFKLMTMVTDPESQHLISFNPAGTSVIVTNFDDFAKDVLPKHFKHSNFSSFIRQLNMYGFYKVNKTPRGQRHTNDSQVWEFSHPKFIRGRTDLLDEIRRKALDNDHGRVEARDLQLNMSLGHLQLRQHLEEIQWRLDQAMEQNSQLREFSASLRKTLIDVLEYIKATNGGHLPFDVNLPPMDVLTSLTPMTSSTQFLSGSGGGGQTEGSGWELMSQQPTGRSHPLQTRPPDGPSIFVTEPGYANLNAIGPRQGSGEAPGSVNGLGGGSAFNSMPPSPNVDGSGGSGPFSMASFQHISPLASRRVSNASSNGRSHTSGAEVLDFVTASEIASRPTVYFNHSGVPIVIPSSSPGEAADIAREGDAFNSLSGGLIGRESRPLTAPPQNPGTVAGARGIIAPMPRRSFSRQNSGLAVDTTTNFIPDSQDRGSHSAVEGGSPSIFGDVTRYTSNGNGSGGGSGMMTHSSMRVPPSQRGQLLLQQGVGLFASAINTPLPPSPIPQSGVQGSYPPSPMPDGVFGFLPPQQHQHQYQQAHAGMGLAVGSDGRGSAMGIADSGVSPHTLSHSFTGSGGGGGNEGNFPFSLSETGGEFEYEDFSGTAGAGAGTGYAGGLEPSSKAQRTPLKRSASSAAEEAAMARSVAAAASEVSRSSSSMGKRKTAA